MCSDFFRCCRKTTLRRKAKGGWVIHSVADMAQWIDEHKFVPPPPSDLIDLEGNDLFVIPGSSFVNPQYGEGFAFTSLQVSGLLAL